jgi:HK97 family phage major capsid protein
MNMTEMKNRIAQLGREIHDDAAKLAAMAMDDTQKDEDVAKQRGTLDAKVARLNALQAAYNAQLGEDTGNLQPAGDPAQERTRSELLKSREYARAFAHAIRTGARPGHDMSAAQHKILYDALTIGGGSTPGEDGGFLVPEEIDHAIHEYSRAVMPLADLLGQMTVNSNSGWFPVATNPSKGMTKMGSEVTQITTSEQPEFKRVSYVLSTYADWLPISNELASDEVSNLFGYISNFYARKYVLTRNELALTALDKLTAGAIKKTDDALALLKTALNVELDPEISVLSTILTNQSGFNYLDGLKDDNGRPLLMPDPTQSTGYLFKGRPVKVASNAVLPNRTVTDTGATKGDYYPIYVGNFEQYATLFTRQALELASTDVGGSAFRTNSIEVRGIARLDCQIFDAAAAVKKEIFIPAT